MNIKVKRKDYGSKCSSDYECQNSKGLYCTPREFSCNCPINFGNSTKYPFYYDSYCDCYAGYFYNNSNICNIEFLNSTDGYFTAKNGKLYDANGKEFLIRGVNSAHLWFDNYDRNYAYQSLLPISRTSANTVRIVWAINLVGMQAGQLEKIIKRIIELKMIPMVELNDASGSGDVISLLNCANWFKDNINLFFIYQKYVLINIANEWSAWGTPLESKIFKIIIFSIYDNIKLKSMEICL